MESTRELKPNSQRIDLSNEETNTSKYNIEDEKELHTQKQTDKDCCTNYDNICSSLRFLNQRVDTKLIFLEKRITENEINVIISTSQEEEECVWVDFSKLDILLSSCKEETTIFKISFKNRVEYHFAQEILNCPSKFYISKSNSLILKIEIILDENSKSEIYKEALVSLVDTLSKIYNASNEEFAKIYCSFIKLIFESYKLIKDDKFSRLKNDKNLFKFYNLIKQDSFVEKSTKAIYDKN